MLHFICNDDDQLLSNLRLHVLYMCILKC